MKFTLELILLSNYYVKIMLRTAIRNYSFSFFACRGNIQQLVNKEKSNKYRLPYYCRAQHHNLLNTEKYCLADRTRLSAQITLSLQCCGWCRPDFVLIKEICQAVFSA